MELKEFFDNKNSNLKQAVNRSYKNDSIIRNQSELARARKRGNFLLRQEIKSWTIECSTKVSLYLNLVLFLIFMFFGVYIAVIASNIIEVELKYDKW
jgi:hypothetical protein